MLRLQLQPGRNYFAFAAHYFAIPQNWSGHPFVFLTVEGTGSGQSYEFAVDFGTGQAVWRFNDDRRGLRTLQFTQTVAQSKIQVDWSHILSVKVSTQSKGSTASLGVGPVEISGPDALRISLPIIPSQGWRTGVVEKTRDGVRNDEAFEPIRVGPGVVAIPLTVPSDLLAGRRLVVLPPQPIKEIPASPVRIERTGMAGYRLELRASDPGALMFEQAYDSRWKADLGGLEGSPLPLFSVMNGFLVRPGLNGASEGTSVSRGSISYQGQGVASVGLSLSAISWFALIFLVLPLAWVMWRTRRAGQFVKRSSTGWPRVGLAVVVAVALAAGGTASVHVWAQLQQQPIRYYWPQALATDPSQFWTTPDQNVQLGQVGGPDRKPAILARTVGPRSFFTILQHTFTPTQDWSARRDVFLSVRGDGSGKRYQFVVYTDDRQVDSISFTFQDSQPGWRVLSFDLQAATQASGTPDLGHVTAIRIGTADRTAPGSLALGSFAISQPESR